VADAYTRWRELLFPEGSSTSEVVDELHAQLAYWDSMGAATVIPVINSGAPYDPGVLDFDTGLTEFTAQITDAMKTAEGEDVQRLDRYAEYVAALKAALAEAQTRKR
jgi:hypothetical protein